MTAGIRHQHRVVAVDAVAAPRDALDDALVALCDIDMAEVGEVALDVADGR